MTKASRSAVQSSALAEKGGDAVQQSGQWTTRAGDRRRILWTYHRFERPQGDDLEGTAPMVVATGLDLTERTRAETSLRDREARLRAVVNTPVDGIVTIDHRGIIESFNPAAERLFGYGADEAIGHPVQMLMPNPYRDQHQGYIDKIPVHR